MTLHSVYLIISVLALLLLLFFFLLYSTSALPLRTACPCISAFKLSRQQDDRCVPLYLILHQGHTPVWCDKKWAADMKVGNYHSHPFCLAALLCRFSCRTSLLPVFLLCMVEGARGGKPTLITYEFLPLVTVTLHLSGCTTPMLFLLQNSAAGLFGVYWSWGDPMWLTVCLSPRTNLLLMCMVGGGNPAPCLSQY